MPNPKNREKIREIIRRWKKLDDQVARTFGDSGEVVTEDREYGWETRPEDAAYLAKVGMEVI